MNTRNFYILFVFFQILTFVFLLIINVIEKNNFLTVPAMNIIILLLFILQIVLFLIFKKNKKFYLTLIILCSLVFLIEIYFMYVFFVKTT